jgi:hypothetical protein
MVRMFVKDESDRSSIPAGAYLKKNMDYTLIGRQKRKIDKRRVDP